jgi:hypothetical protein
MMILMMIMWKGHLVHTGVKGNAYNVLVGKPEETTWEI